jgi:hypothetical protein
MTAMLRGVLVVGLVSCLAGAASAAGEVVRSYPIPGHGALELKLPPDWKDSVRQPPHGLPPTLEFAPPSGKAFDLLVTVMWSPKKDPKFTAPETIKDVVLQTGQGQLSQAVEKELPWNPITMEGRGTIAYIYTLTDKAPAPGSFEYMTQGVFAAGEFQLSFTLLTHEKKSAALRPTLKALATARQTQRPGAAR